MDRRKKSIGFVGSSNNKMYLGLKDIIREHALVYLPVKSLFKFRTVCRDWRNHISTPFFAHNQSLYCRTVSGFFYQITGKSPSFLSINPESTNVPDPSLKFLPEAVDIRASSNGLICCQACDGDKCYYICNPVTKQYKKLPKSSADHGPDPHVVLVFEPSVLSFIADYKLVCAFPSADFDGATEFEIYSSSDDCWKVSGEICFATERLASKLGVYADGVVYWQTQSYGALAFDIKKERSRIVRNYGMHNSPLGSFNGKLCMAKVNANSVAVTVLSNVYTNTMEMHSKSNAWEDKTRFQLDLTLFEGHKSGQLVVLFVSEDLVLLQAGKTIVSHDLKTNESKTVCSDADTGMRLFSYVNSLVCV